jgi:alpha-tubulin suppressor-like RCC1 family protein
MPSNFQKSDDVFGTIDLDDAYITDSWLVDKYVGGTLFGWGSGTNGGLGLGNNAYYSSPIQVGSLTSWSYVSACSTTSGTLRNFSMAIKTDGTLWAWGENRTGQLGQGHRTNTYSSPIQVGALTNWKQVSAGQGYVLAVQKNGTAWAWGWNTYGQLGNDNIAYYSSPIQIGALTNWKQVTASDGGANNSSSAAVKYDGTLWTWGSNIAGTLGTAGVNNYYSSPIQVGSLTNWKEVWVGFDRGNSGTGWMAAVKTDGTLWTWGHNGNGQLGNGNIAYYSSPIQVGALTNWKSVYVGGVSCLAIKTDGTLWGWGNNSSGQLGNENTVNYSSPIQVGTLTNWKHVSIRAVSSTSYSTLAVKTDGTLWGWGLGTSGQLGQSNRANYSSPVQVGSLTNWKYVATGGTHTIGMTFTDLN